MIKIHSFLLSILLFALLFGLTSSKVFAETPVQIINSDHIKLEQFQMEYFVDETEKMSFTQVQQQHFKTSSNSLSLGTSSKATWSKIVLKNVKQTILSSDINRIVLYR